MPLLSGIGLLCKIMKHKSLKNIPVISKCHLIAFLAISIFFTDENVRLVLLNSVDLLLLVITPNELCVQ